LECFVPDLARFGESNQAVRVLPESRSDRVRLNASLHYPVEQRVDTQVIVVAGGNVEVLPVSLRYIWPSELDLMGQLAGFELESRYAGWSKERFTAQSGFHVSVYRASH
jgi:hypothetical protein